MFFKKMDDRAITPKRGNPYDAGLDLYALEDVNIAPGQIVKIKTGIHIALKEYEVGLYWEKSGRAWDMKADLPIGLQILGGCIDGPYRGELIIIATNVNLEYQLKLFDWYTNEHDASFDTSIAYRNTIIQNYEASWIHIPYGKAVTQLLISNGLKFDQAQELSPSEWDARFNNTVRGQRGFGSTD